MPHQFLSRFIGMKAITQILSWGEGTFIFFTNAHPIVAINEGDLKLTADFLQTFYFLTIDGIMFRITRLDRSADENLTFRKAFLNGLYGVHSPLHHSIEVRIVGSHSEAEKVGCRIFSCIYFGNKFLNMDWGAVVVALTQFYRIRCRQPPPRDTKEICRAIFLSVVMRRPRCRTYTYIMVCGTTKVCNKRC